jgi:hypothetical protein
MPDSNQKDAQPLGTEKTSLPSSGEKVLRYEDTPPKAEPPKRIHPRRPLPPVPDAKPDPCEDKSSE